MAPLRISLTATVAVVAVIALAHCTAAATPATMSPHHLVRAAQQLAATAASPRADDAGMNGFGVCTFIPHSIVWDVRADIPVGGNCTRSWGPALSSLGGGDTTINAWSCGANEACYAEGLLEGATCHTPATHGQSCNALDPNSCQSPTVGIIAFSDLRCVPDKGKTTGTCRYLGQLSDTCQSTEDCVEGSCQNGVCQGTLGKGDACDDASIAAMRLSGAIESGANDPVCKVGLYCSDATGKCATVAAEGDACTDDDDQCGWNSCNNRLHSPVCQRPYSQDDGALVSDDNLCSSQYMDPETHKCASSRRGANSTTDGPCQQTADCISTDDTCACVGNGNGACKPLMKKYTSLAAAFTSCVADSDCSPSSSVAWDQSCVSKSCKSVREEVLCASARMLIGEFNSGETEIDGDAGDEMDSLLDLWYNCRGLSTLAIVLIAVGSIVLVGGVVACWMRRNRTHKIDSAYQAMHDPAAP